MTYVNLSKLRYSGIFLLFYILPFNLPTKDLYQILSEIETSSSEGAATLKQSFQTRFSGSCSLVVDSTTVLANGLRNSNCTVEAGVEGYPASFCSYDGKASKENSFTLNGVPLAGTTGVVKLTVSCPQESESTFVKVDRVRPVYQWM